VSDFLNNLKGYEQQLQFTKKELINTVSDFKTASLNNAANDAKVHRSLIGKIVLDPKLDPDPYGYHGIPLTTRLESMGWK